MEKAVEFKKPEPKWVPSQDQTRKTPPRVGRFEMECDCGELLVGTTDEELYDLYQEHQVFLHPPSPEQWAAAGKKLSEMQEAKPKK